MLLKYLHYLKYFDDCKDKVDACNVNVVMCRSACRVSLTHAHVNNTCIWQSTETQEMEVDVYNSPRKTERQVEMLRLISGCLSAGIQYSQYRELMNWLNMHCISYTLFKPLTHWFHKHTLKLSHLSKENEIKHLILNTDIGDPVTVIGDGFWSKRGYDSKNGTVCLLSAKYDSIIVLLEYYEIILLYY